MQPSAKPPRPEGTRQRQAQAHAAQLAGKGLPPLPPLPALPTLPGEARWRDLLSQAQWALSQLSREMQEYSEQRSQQWQESERGESFQERLEAVQELVASIEELPELSAANTKKSVKNP